MAVVVVQRAVDGERDVHGGIGQLILSELNM